MSFVQGKGGVLSGVWLVNTTVATLPMIYQWLSANVAGHTKRPFAMALLAGSFNVGNIIGPQTFQARDAPQYIPAKVTVFATLAAGAVCAPLLKLYYQWENCRRDKRDEQQVDIAVDTTDQDWQNLTDKENRGFRYVL